jgi:mono/diheme cytochrome c family protein
LREDTFTIQVRAPGDKLHSFYKDELTEIRRHTGATPMPAYKTSLSEAEREDLVAYLASLRGAK